MRPGAMRGWGGVLLFFGCNVLFAAGLFSHALLYNFYLDGLGIGEAAMGGAAAALTAGGLVALLPAGQVVDRLGPRRAYGVAALFCATGLGSGAFATSPGWIGATAFLAGAGTAAWRVAMGPMIMRLSEGPRRDRAFSWNVALLLGSGAVWTAVSGAIPGWLSRASGVGEGTGVRVSLVIGALATLASALLLGLVRVGPPPAAASASTTEASPGIRDRIGIPARLALLVLVVAVWMMAGGLVLPFLNLYFLRVHGMGVGRIGLLFGVAQAITALVVFGSGDLAARFGSRRLLLVWAVPFAPLLWLLGIAGSRVMAIALYLIQGFVPPSTNPLIDQILLERARADRQGAVSTWRNAATELSGLVGAAAGGWLLEATSFRTLFGVAGAVAVAGLAGLAVTLRAER